MRSSESDYRRTAAAVDTSARREHRVFTICRYAADVIFSLHAAAA